MTVDMVDTLDKLDRLDTLDTLNNLRVSWESPAGTGRIPAGTGRPETSLSWYSQVVESV